MPDLTPPAVRVFAAALGLALDGEDLEEVTHRLNAFLDALAPLDDLGLDGVEPAPPVVPGA
ncbi:MAG TPA: hypothetical protein VFX28_08705 [Methylomirabilota bacterium]|nr:hypothetical protein [Methylomirabilota bacterium]